VISPTSIEDDYEDVPPPPPPPPKPKPSTAPAPPPKTNFTDEGDGYNNIGLKTRGYKDGQGGVKDQYTPGWALDDNTGTT